MLSGDDQNNEPGTKQWSFKQSDSDISLLGTQDGTVFVGNSKGNLYAIDATTGTEEWSLELGDGKLIYATVVGKTMYVGSTDHTLYLVDLDNEIAKWSFKTDGWIGSSPTVVDGTVFVGSHDNTLYAVDASTGIEEWSFKTEDWILPSPTVANETVYMLSNNTLYAVDAAIGVELWSYDIDVFPGSDMVVMDGTVYVGSTDHNLYAVNAANGNQQWVFDTEGMITASAIVADETVYVGNAEGSLCAVNAATGTEKWSFEAEDRFESKPTMDDGTIYVTCLDSHLYAVDATTGTQKWSFETEAKTKSSATVIDGTVYVGSTDHNIYAVDATTGTQKWAFDTGEKIRSSPYVFDGLVYVHGADGNLYAITVSTGSANGGDQRRSKSDEEQIVQNQSGNTDDIHSSISESQLPVDNTNKIPNISRVESPDRQTLSPETFSHEAVIERTPTTVVHKIIVDRIDDPIAVKHPATSTVSRATFDSFSYEGQQWSQLADHSHIVGVVDWGESPLSWLTHDATIPWVAMEYMDGGDLRENFEQFSVKEKYWIAVQVADAIWYAHHEGGGLTHRDLKPENILLRETPGDNYDVPKVADWELAQTILNRSDNVGITTPEYSAPEQKDQAVTDHLTDQFQLGVVFYELFTGVHPFSGDLEAASRKEIMTEIVENEPVPPSEQRGLLSPELDSIIMKMLSKSPENRFEAMIQVRDELNALQLRERYSEGQESAFKQKDNQGGTNRRRENPVNRGDRIVSDSEDSTSTRSDKKVGFIERVEILGESRSKEVLVKSDSGASQTEIDSSLADEIKIPVTKEEVEDLRSTKRAVKYGTANILLNNNKHEVNVRIVDRSHLEYPVLLGRDVLRNYRVDVRRRVDE